MHKVSQPYQFLSAEYFKHFILFRTFKMRWTDYSGGLRAGLPGFDFKQGQDIFSLLYSVQTGSEAHSAS
jgi:hypothetical protein